MKPPSRGTWVRRVSRGLIFAGATMGCGNGSDSAGAEGTASTQGPDVPAPVDCEGTGDADPLRWVGEGRAAGVSGLRAVSILGERGYTCSSIGGLATWDLSGDVPTLLADDRQPCVAVTTDPERSLIAVARGQTVDILDVKGVAVGTWTAIGPIESLAFVGDQLGVAAGTAGWALLTTEGTQVSAFADAQSDSRALALAGPRLVVADGATGVRLFDLQGDAIEPIATAPLGGPALDVAVSEQHVFATTLEGVASLELTSEPGLELMTQIETPGSAVALAVLGTRAIVSDFEHVVELDLAQPAEPRLSNLESLVTDDPLDRTVALAADTTSERVYVVQWDSLHVYDTQCPGANGAIHSDLRSVDFRMINAGDSRSMVVPLRNLGAAPLSLTSVSATLSSVSSDFEPTTLLPGESTSFEATFSPTDDAPRTGQLEITSDDPDQPRYVIPVSGNISGVRVGEPLVPFRSIDVRGRVWEHQDAVGQVLLLAYFADW